MGRGDSTWYGDPPRLEMHAAKVHVGACCRESKGYTAHAQPADRSCADCTIWNRRNHSTTLNLDSAAARKSSKGHSQRSRVSSAGSSQSNGCASSVLRAPQNLHSPRAQMGAASRSGRRPRPGRLWRTLTAAGSREEDEVEREGQRKAHRELEGEAWAASISAGSCKRQQRCGARAACGQ